MGYREAPSLYAYTGSTPVNSSGPAGFMGDIRWGPGWAPEPPPPPWPGFPGKVFPIWPGLPSPIIPPRKPLWTEWKGAGFLDRVDIVIMDNGSIIGVTAPNLLLNGAMHVPDTDTHYSLTTRSFLRKRPTNPIWRAF